MNKILIHVYVPALQMWFDVLIPDFLKCNDIVSALGNLIADVTEGKYYSSGEEILCSNDSLKVFKGEKTLNEYGVTNGENLLFM